MTDRACVRPSTIERRVRVLISPARPAGADRSRSSSCARGLVTAVAVGIEKRAQSLLAQPTRIPWARIALQERERDPTVKGTEHADRARPEPLQLRAQLVGQRYPRGHEILPRSGQRPDHLGLIAIGPQEPEAMTIRPRQLTHHEAIKAIGLAA
jgi:hypothetical protein